MEIVINVKLVLFVVAMTIIAIILNTMLSYWIDKWLKK